MFEEVVEHIWEWEWVVVEREFEMEVVAHI